MPFSPPLQVGQVPAGGVTRRPGAGLDEPGRVLVHAAFTAHPCLRDWPATALDALCAAGRMRSWFDGERIIAQGAPCDEILIVVSGAVAVGWSNAEGARAVMAYVRPGEVINIVPVLDGRGAMHDQCAHGLTTLFHVPREAFFAQLNADAALLRSVFDLICSRSRLLHERIGRAALLSLRARLADQLLALAEWYGLPAAQGIELSIRLSQEDLASLLSASRQSVNKELRKLAEQGIVDIRYSRLTVLDLPRLQRVRLEQE